MKTNSIIEGDKNSIENNILSQKEICREEKRKKRRKFIQLCIKQKWLFALSIPIVIWLFVFCITPLWGWVYAFFRYVPGLSLSEMKFVGLKYFIEALTDPEFWNALKNTLMMSVLNVIFACFLCPLAFALFLNELKNEWVKKSIQTISYLPHFVSWVVVAGIFSTLLSSSGPINELLFSLGLIKEKVTFLAKPEWFYAIITTATVWKELGWNAIIYIAAIAGIDQELYEAASVDGAGRFRKMWNITIPCILPTIIILLIINIGGVLGGGFEKQMLFQNAVNTHKAMVLDLFVLQYGIKTMKISFGVAVGILTSLTSLILVYTANRISKKYTDNSLM